VEFTGRVWKFGSNVDTDAIIPARYLVTTDPAELASHCMEGIDRDFARKCSSGDIIVAGSNFGCGSSREHAPVAIKGAGIACVIAESFARIFYRNAINMGLPAVEVLPAAVEAIHQGDVVFVSLSQGILRNRTTGAEFPLRPIPDFMRTLLESGGLIPYVRRRRFNAP